MLFNGKDLNDWEASEHPETFRIEAGNLVVTAGDHKGRANDPKRGKYIAFALP